VAFDASQNEQVQVFHSRTEFSIGGAASSPDLPPLQPEAPAEIVPEASGFLGAPPEFAASPDEQPFFQASDAAVDADQTIKM
ncbi:hypothetical protein NL529_32945, partial [Klebsiella pneumoniae]|nr:hypothetical protein [Klebsiella pneumoniae]